MNPKTVFLNFVPTDSLEIYANSLVGQIVQRAPYDAATSSTIEKIDESYLCRIEIISVLGRFIGVGSATQSHLALEKARQRIAWQIKKWHQRRLLVPMYT